MQTRPFDVLLYGAGGFTGRRTVVYFSAHAPPSLRWALAGRHRAKLESARALATGPAQPAQLLRADSGDRGSVEAAISQARVVLSTAGPFALYGDAVVDACVRFGTHYVDITGETPWAADVISRHHARAAETGLRIIPFCGFDSVPSDLGTFLLVDFLRSQNTGCAAVKGAFRFRGGLNGGTAATALQLFESGQARRAQEPFLLDGSRAHSAEEVAASRDPTRPHFDSDFGRWLTPYVMGSINTRVVRRSAALAAETDAPYGSHFTFQEFQAVRGRARASALAAGGALFQRLLGSPLRPLLRQLLPAPGTGPSEEAIASGWFRYDLVARGEDGTLAYGLVKDTGDPGNAVTVKCVCESALALALEAEKLPGGPARGGVLTPATGLGHVLVERLRARGMVLTAERQPPAQA